MKQYGGFWLIITSALICFTLYSFYDGNLFGFEVKKCSIAEDLTYETTCDSISDDVAIGDSAATSFDPRIAIEPDTASKTILFIGDSMLEGLGPRMASYAKKNGHKLYNVIWYSSTSEIWGRCDTLKHFIKTFNPDYILVSLGANELFVKDIKKKRKKYVEHILSQIGNIPYVWIGPPNWKPDTGINELVESTVDDGSFFLSDGMHFDRAKDGAHPTRTSAALWMDSIASWITTKSNHPIKLERPDKNLYRPNRVIILQPAK